MNKINCSIFLLSDDNVFWELSDVIFLGSLPFDVLNFTDQCSAFLVDQGINVLLYFVVTARHLGNDEVEENKGGEDDHDQPGDPEKNMLLGQWLVFDHAEVKVAKGKTESCE